MIKNTSKNGWFVPNCCTNQNPHKHWVFEVKIKRNLEKVVCAKMYAKPLLYRSKSALL